MAGQTYVYREGSSSPVNDNQLPAPAEPPLPPRQSVAQVVAAADLEKDPDSSTYTYPRKYQQPSKAHIFEDPDKLKAPGVFHSWDFSGAYLAHRLAMVAWVFRSTAFFLSIGFLGFLAVQACLAVCTTLSTVKAGVEVAATGASYMGFWAICYQAATMAHRLLPFAATLHDLVMPPPLAIGPVPLQLPLCLETMDSRILSALGCSLISFLGCLVGRPG